MIHLAEKLINSIAHKDAISALSGMVKMEAILSHVVLLATSGDIVKMTGAISAIVSCCKCSTEQVDHFWISYIISHHIARYWLKQRKSLNLKSLAELNAGVPHVHDAPMGRNGV